MLHNIALNSLIPKGRVTCELRDNLLAMTTDRALPTQRFDAEHLSIQSYVSLPGQYRLPMRIDLTVKIDAPGLYILTGDGHVNFGTPWSDNRRLDDIVAPSRKIAYFHNHMTMDQFTDISLLYDMKEMQILIDGEERYYSSKERYMKSKEFKERNREGFELKIACDKLVNVSIQSISVTEYEDTCGILHGDKELPAAVVRNLGVPEGEKPTFEKCISLLPEPIQKEIDSIDSYLKSLTPLKFRRTIEKNGNKITYVAADFGISYAIYVSNDIFDHSLQWYLITNGKPETWHRKADLMEAALDRLQHSSEEFAERMFYSLDDCVGCYQNCLGKTSYRFRGRQKTVCHGKLKFKMHADGFKDVRRFIDELKKLIEE